MEVIKEGRDITITIDEYEARLIIGGLYDRSLITDDSGYRPGVELRLELIALMGTDAEKREAREELEQLIPFQLTPQEIEGLRNEAEQAAIIARARDRWRRGINIYEQG
jgi:hypothetical protein